MLFPYQNGKWLRKKETKSCGKSKPVLGAHINVSFVFFRLLTIFLDELLYFRNSIVDRILKIVFIASLEIESQTIE